MWRTLLVAICFLLPFTPFWFGTVWIEWAGMPLLDFLANVFPLLMLAAMVYKYGVSKNNNELRRANDEKGNYVKPLAIVTSTMMIVIPVILSIHPDILDKYDDCQHSQKRPFKWLCAHEVLSFPLQQLNMRYENYSPERIIAVDTDERFTHYLFIVDKTLSIKEINSKNGKELLGVIHDSLRQHFDTLLFDSNKVSIESSLVDKTVLYNVKTLLDSKHTMDSFYFDIQFYYGHDQRLTAVDEHLVPIGNTGQLYVPPIDTLNKDSIRDNIFEAVSNAYFSTINVYDNSVRDRINRLNLTQKTDLTQMVTLINTRLLEINKEDSDSKVCVYLLSDLDDNFYSFPRVKPYSRELLQLSNNPALHEFNIISFPCHSGNTYEVESSKAFKQTCEQTLDQFFRHIQLVSLTQIDKTVHSIMREFAECKKSHITSKEPVPLYYPYSEDLDPNVGKGKIIFDTSGFSDTVAISLVCKNMANEDLFLKLKQGNDSVILSANHDDIMFVQRNKDLDLSLHSTNATADKKMFLRVSDTKRNKIVDYPVITYPLLPLTTSIYLILFYTIIICSLSLIILLPSIIQLSILHNKRVEIGRSVKIDRFMNRNYLLTNLGPLSEDIIRTYYCVSSLYTRIMSSTWRIRYAMLTGTTLAFNYWYYDRIINQINIDKNGHYMFGASGYFFVIFILLAYVWKDFKCAYYKAVVH